MNWDLYKQHLLSTLPNAKLTSGGKEINCRCQYCSDGKSAYSAHFYISIPQSNNEPSLYNCMKCGARGMVNHNTLIDWGIYDKDIAVDINDYNKKILQSSKNRAYNESQVYQIRHSYITMNDKSEQKRRYLVERLGYDLNFAQIADLKICLNISDLLNENQIYNYTRSEMIMKQLDEYFLGFISIDNAFLNMRRTCEEGIVYKNIDKRYINYDIFNKYNNSQRFYTIPTAVDINSPNRIKVHLAEGPFDILSIYLNCRNQEPGIYTSIAGNKYHSILNYFLSTFKLPYIELHLYLDNDKFGTLDRVRWILDKIPDKSFPVYMHKNIYPNEKDFGVPYNRINESILQIR